MANHESLTGAKESKKDEFYTLYSDIENEMNAYVEYNPDVFRNKTILLPCDDPETSNFTRYFASNFQRFGLKKLISTSYARGAANMQPTLFELDSPLYDETKHETHGRLYTLTHDSDGSGEIDEDDVEFKGYLEGDGDFRSREVCKLRDEADIIITNPPFSLFREFLAWIMSANKQFAIIAHQNAITYKEVFPLLRENKIWLGQGFKGNIGFFEAPLYEDYAKASMHKEGLIRVSGVVWFTNIDLGKRHEPLLLDTMAHNLKYNKTLRKRFIGDDGSLSYPHYDNCDAIEVPFTDAIPSDFEGVMGVPITFLDKYNPDQFQILGLSRDMDIPTKTGMSEYLLRDYFAQGGKGSMKPGHPDLGYYDANKKVVIPYMRILIKKKGNI